MSLGSALFPKIKRDLLALFFLNPNSKFYIRQIIRRINSTSAQVQLELKSLVEASILISIIDDNKKYYSVNPDCSIYKELSKIVLKTFGITDLLNNSLDSIKEKLKLAIIYGSVAKGEDTGSSDVDVLIVGDVSFKEIAILFDPIEKLINRSINPTVYSTEQFESKYTSDNHFIKTVLGDEFILLHGEIDDTSKLA